MAKRRRNTSDVCKSDISESVKRLAELRATKQSNSVWWASGEYKKQTITVRGTSAGNAFSIWESKVNNLEFN